MAYTGNDLVTIVTPDDTLYHFLSILTVRFNVLRDYFIDNPTDREILLDVSTTGLQALFAYTDNATLPSTVDEWIELLEVADYLELSPVYQRSLLQQASQGFVDLYEPTLNEDFLYYSGPMGSANLTLREAIDEFIFLRDNRHV